MKRLHFFCLISKTLTPTRSFRSRDAVPFAAFPYSSGAASAGSGTGQHMFMAQYLVESCGFDQEKAADVSKQLRGIKSRQQPDSVLAFLRSYGFDDKTIKNIIIFFPRCLVLDVEKSLAPKFRAFHDLGLSRSDIANLIRSTNVILSSRLETILSKIQFWQSILGSKDLVVNLFKRNRWFLGSNVKKRVQPNVEILQECGVVGQKHASILKFQPGIVLQRPDSLKSLISRAGNLGVPRTSGTFHWTLWALYLVKPQKFKMQMELFSGFGWSEDDFVAAFRRCPSFPTLSPKNLQRKMEFFLNEAGFASSRVVMCPIMLTFSLEKKLIPRLQVFRFLKSRGYYKTDDKLSIYLTIPEKIFLEKYILPYKDECPDLIEFYASSKNTNASGLQ